MMDVNILRRLASEKALPHIESGMIVGLGSGRTIADSFLPLLAGRINSGALRDVYFVPSSYQVELRALEMGFKLLSFNQVDYVDVTVDSADLFEKETFTAIKGGGGALLLEKVLSTMSKKVVLILDEAKLVERIPPGVLIPIEVVPNLILNVKKHLEKTLGVDIRIRSGSGKVGPVITDLGNAILDIPYANNISLEKLDDILNETPGVLENGIFRNIVSHAYAGTSSGVLEFKREIW
ncbi:MAG: ribose 5-phosphate isomerase A [Thermoproteota archaeon]